ncbi:DUF6688 family protein [Bacillus pacificus]
MRSEYQNVIRVIRNFYDKYGYPISKHILIRNGRLTLFSYF